MWPTGGPIHPTQQHEYVFGFLVFFSFVNCFLVCDHFPRNVYFIESHGAPFTTLYLSLMKFFNQCSAAFKRVHSAFFQRSSNRLDCCSRHLMLFMQQHSEASLRILATTHIVFATTFHVSSFNMFQHSI